MSEISENEIVFFPNDNDFIEYASKISGIKKSDIFKAIKSNTLFKGREYLNDMKPLTNTNIFPDDFYVKSPKFYSKYYTYPATWSFLKLKIKAIREKGISYENWKARA